MKTINSKKKGFAGSVRINGNDVFINSKDGTGFYKAIKLMEPLVHKLAQFGLSLCPWTLFEDMKQDIYVFIMEGINKYNAEKGASLSTFLYSFVKCRLIDYSRKKDPLRGKCIFVDPEVFYELNPVEKIDLIKKIECWDSRWRKIIFRVFINEDKISDVADDEDFTPWGLTRAIRRKIKEAREI